MFIFWLQFLGSFLLYNTDCICVVENRDRLFGVGGGLGGFVFVFTSATLSMCIMSVTDFQLTIFFTNHRFLTHRIGKITTDGFKGRGRCHGGRVVTLSSPTSEAGFRFPARPQVGKLVVACRWSAVYSTES